MLYLFDRFAYNTKNIDMKRENRNPISIKTVASFLFMIGIMPHTEGSPLSGYFQSREFIETILETAVDAIITIVGFPKDLREVYLGEGGIISNASEGTCLIDMTTSEPSLAQEIFQKASDKGIHAVDAPVSGGDVGARNAALSIMVTWI